MQQPSLAGAGNIASPDAIDPFPLWEHARREAPVGQIGTMDGRATYWVTRWSDVEQVLRDNDTFSSEINAETVGQVMGPMLVGMDGVEHRRYRELVAKAFRASSLERWGVELIEPTVRELLDRIATRGRADLVADFTHQYPVKIIACILGVPVGDYERFQQWAEDINYGPTDLGRSLPASKAMQEYLRPIVESRRANPASDLISDLVTAEVDGHRLDDEHIYGFLRLLLPAGAETTYRMLGTSLYCLLTRPDVLDEVRADRALVHDVIEETLRWQASVTVVNRSPVHDVEIGGVAIPAGSSVLVATASANRDADRYDDPDVVEETLRWQASVTVVNRSPVHDVEIGGVAIPAGSSVLVATASANRDADRYDDPDVWDIHRPAKPHLAFGTGRHQCLGMHLARLELDIALNAVLDRLPGLRLDPAEPDPRLRGFAFRSPDRLPVLFDPAG